MNKQKYCLYLYDVWGNSKDGYEINDVHKALVGTIFDCKPVIIEIDDETTDYQLNRKIGCCGIEWAPDFNAGEFIFGRNKRNHKPFGELRLIESE